MTDSPRSELFLSIDLVGSTGYKQVPGAQWQKTFLAFYRQFPQTLGTFLIGTGLEFILWKAIGDELIFTVMVEHEDQVYDAVRIWLRAMAEYEKTALEKVGLAAQGGAFIGTFSGPDSEATVPRATGYDGSDASFILRNDAALKGPRKHTKFLYDYFGPSIDTGFRVIGECHRRNFTLAIEVTLALLVANSDHDDRHLDDLIFLGSRPFKGVWKGRDYPVFALDRHHEDKINTALRTLGGQPLDLEAARDLCRHCLASPGWPSGIYLPKSGSDVVKQVPTDPLTDLRHEAHQEALAGRESMAKEREGEQLEPEPPLGKTVNVPAETADDQGDTASGPVTK